MAVVSEARQRIVETADRLFYEHGVRAVGIDRIIAEAGVAKMSLYKHFASKDDLILEVLRHREGTFTAWFGDAMAKHARKTKDPVGAFFGALKDWFERPDFRGCAFINAAVELADPKHPGFAFVQGQKSRFATFLRQTIERAVGTKAGKHAAAAVALLVEGAVVTALIQGSPAAADTAREAAARLLGASRAA